MQKMILHAIAATCCAAPLFAADVASSVDPTQLPAHKVTKDARYLSSHDAYHLIWEDPAILFVDVRDAIEIAQFGHPKNVDANIPVRIQSFGTRAMPQTDALALNPDFLDSMNRLRDAFGKSRHDMIILTCGSGRRSAEAARILGEHGYTNVWHVPDGYEGDEAIGYNTDNAWKAAGLPWSVKLALNTEWSLVLSE